MLFVALNTDFVALNTDFVALNTDATLTTAQILAHCRANLSKYKLPVDITVLDELPPNAVGKLDKPTLRRTLAAQPA